MRLISNKLGWCCLALFFGLEAQALPRFPRLNPAVEAEVVAVLSSSERLAAFRWQMMGVQAGETRTLMQTLLHGENTQLRNAIEERLAFLNQEFPVTEIPTGARRLRLRNQVESWLAVDTSLTKSGWVVFQKRAQNLTLNRVPFMSQSMIFQIADLKMKAGLSARAWKVPPTSGEAAFEDWLRRLGSKEFKILDVANPIPEVGIKVELPKLTGGVKEVSRSDSALRRLFLRNVSPKTQVSPEYFVPGLTQGRAPPHTPSELFVPILTDGRAPSLAPWTVEQWMARKIQMGQDSAEWVIREPSQGLAALVREVELPGEVKRTLLRDEHIRSVDRRLGRLQELEILPPVVGLHLPVPSSGIEVSQIIYSLEALQNIPKTHRLIPASRLLDGANRVEALFLLGQARAQLLVRYGIQKFRWNLDRVMVQVDGVASQPVKVFLMDLDDSVAFTPYLDEVANTNLVTNWVHQEMSIASTAFSRGQDAHHLLPVDRIRTVQLMGAASTGDVSLMDSAFWREISRLLGVSPGEFVVPGGYFSKNLELVARWRALFDK